MKHALQGVTKRIRNLLGVRRQRQLPPVGTRPGINSYIYCDTVKMLITGEMDDTLWRWLAGKHWRKLAHSDDRRRYRHLPSRAFRLLLQAPPEERDAVYAKIVAAGQRYPLTHALPESHLVRRQRQRMA